MQNHNARTEEGIARKEEEFVKISANLPAASVETLKTLARLRGSTMTEALRHAITLESFFVEAEREGSKILLEKSDGKIVQLLNVG